MPMIVVTSLVAEPLKTCQIFYIVTFTTKCTFYEMFHFFHIGHVKKKFL